MKFTIPSIFVFRMKKRKQTTGKRSLGILIVLLIGASVAYYAFQKTEHRKRLKAEAEASFDPDFNPLPAGFARQHRDSIQAFFMINCS